MQRIFKYGDNQNKTLTLEYFGICNVFLCHHIQELQTLKIVQFFAHPVDEVAVIRKKGTLHLTVLSQVFIEFNNYGTVGNDFE